MWVTITRSWWSLVLRGVVAILFGLLVIALPNIGLAVLIALFGAYALVNGILAIVVALSHIGRRGDEWPLLLEGLLGVAIGVITFVWPGLTALALLYLIAAWAILTGAVQVVAAVQLRRALHNEWLLIVSGILSVVFGVLLVIAPGAGALAVLFLIGFYAIFFGVLLISLGLRLQRLQHAVEHAVEPIAQPRPAPAPPSNVAGATS